MGAKPKYITLTLKVMPEDGQYSAICVELGTASCGDTVDEAFKNLRDAISVDLNTLEQIGERARFFKERGIQMFDAPKAWHMLKGQIEVGEFITKEDVPVPV